MAHLKLFGRAAYWGRRWDFIIQAPTALLCILLILMISVRVLSASNFEFDILTLGNYLPFSAWEIAFPPSLSTEETGELPIPDNPWFFAGIRSEVKFSYGPLLFGFRSNQQYQGAITKDTARLLARSSQKPGLPTTQQFDLGADFLQTEFKAFDLVVTKGSGRFSYWLRGSMLVPGDYQSLYAVGTGNSNAENEEIWVSMDYVYKSASKGMGWAAGGGLLYQTGSHKASLEVYNLVGKLIWPETRVERGKFNYKVKTYRDGVPSNEPLFKGTISTESLGIVPSPYWVLKYEAIGPIRGDIQLENCGGQVRLTSQYWFKPNRSRNAFI